MNDSKIPVRYSKALFLSAREINLEKKVYNDLEFIRSTLNEKGFREFLESPIIKTSEKKHLVRKVFGNHLQPLSLKFFELLLTNKREIYLEAVIRDYISLFNEANGIKNASLKTTFKVTAEIKKKFISMLESTFHSKIEMEEVIDPGLIGGFILIVEHEQFDASVKTSLSRIQKKLTETK